MSGPRSVGLPQLYERASYPSTTSSSRRLIKDASDRVSPPGIETEEPNLVISNLGVLKALIFKLPVIFEFIEGFVPLFLGVECSMRISTLNPGFWSG